MKYKRVVVLLNDEEYRDVKKMAGLVPLSAWFRSKALGTDLELEECLHLNRAVNDMEPTENRAAQVLEKGFSACKHGLQFCKKCT